MSERDGRDAVAAAFASYQGVAQEAFPATTPDAVFATARGRATRRRATAMAAVAAAVLAVMVTGTVMVRATAAPDPVPPAVPPSAPPPSTGPPVTPAPAGRYEAVPPAVPDLGNQVRFLDDETALAVRNATLRLPEWPGVYRDMCPAGEYAFASGQATIGEHPSGYPWTFQILFRGRQGIFADLDGATGDELLVPLYCGFNKLQSSLLALKPAGAGFQVMGYVVVASEQIGGPDRFFADGAELVVEIMEPALPAEFEQRRRYRWQGDRFVQVSGPTGVPERSGDPTTVDPRNWSFLIGIDGDDPCGTGGLLSFVGGGSGVWAYDSEEDQVSLPAATYLISGVSRGVLDGGQPAVLVTLTCERPDGHAETWLHSLDHEPVVRTGVSGVTGIVSHRIVDGLVEVMVETADGVEARRYRPDAHAWERVP